MIWVIILAAGESRRMGKPKLLLRFGEKTIIETVTESVLASGVKNVLVVLGAAQKRIEAVIKDYHLKVIHNPDYRKGMLSSVQRGFRSLPLDCSAVVVVLGDQPGLRSDVIDELVAAYSKSGRGIVLPVYRGERGHPVLIDRKYQPEIEALSPDVGLRGVVYRHPEDILEVEVETPAVLKDIDDESDYRRELKDRD